MNEQVTAFFRDFAIQIPSILTILGCIIFAIVRWKYHPRVSLVVMIGLLLLLIHFFLFAVLYAWIPEWIIRSADATSRAAITRNVYIVMAVIYNCLEAIPFALLLIAIFMRRGSPPALQANKLN